MTEAPPALPTRLKFAIVRQVAARACLSGLCVAALEAALFAQDSSSAAPASPSAPPAIVPPPGPPNGGKGPPMPMRRPGMPGKAGPGGKAGDPRFPRPGAPGNNLSPMNLEGFEKLPEEEKKQLRAAIEKAWKLPALQQAKDRYIRASEEFRATMRRSIIEVDPEVVKILEKIKPEQQMDPRLMPKLPPPTDENFARVAVDRLGMEMMALVRPEMRGRIRAVHDQVMKQAEVAEAAKMLLEAPPDQRIDALGRLREVYRKAMAREFPNSPRAQPRQTSADASGAPPPPAPELPKP